MTTSFNVSVILALVVSPVLALNAARVEAEGWPTQPLHIVVGFGQGGGTDVVTRIVAPALAETLGRPVVVDNKPGDGGTTAAQIVATSPRDGSIAFMMNSGHTISAAMYKSLPYDSIRDFQPVMLVASSSLVVLANNKFPGKDINDLIAIAKKQPNKLSFGSVGVGSTQHFACELLRQLGGIEMKHTVYPDTPTELAALKAGEVQIVCELIQAAIGRIRAGELIPLGVTAPFRWQALPDVRTVREQGILSYDVTSWYGLAFPAGTSDAIVNTTNRAMRSVLRRDSLRKMIAEAGAAVEPSTTEEFNDHLHIEIAKWKRVRDQAGIQPK